MAFGNSNTRFTKASTPQAGSALNVSNRILGSNPRKQKLTEASGTNPSKLGGGAKIAPASGGTKYAQDTAPHKSLSTDFGVGGPGFTEINLKGFK